MAAFHSRSVKPLAEYYADWMLDNLAKVADTGPPGSKDEAELTQTEVMRLTRAMYRFHLLCQIADPVDRAIRQSRKANVKALLDILQPWETEELFSFYQFAEMKYEHVLMDVHWDLHPNNPRFADQDRPPTPEGAFDLENSLDRSESVEGLTLRGLPLLLKVIFKIKDHADLVSTMQLNITRSYIPLNALEGVLGETEQVQRNWNNPTERDRLQEARAELPFRGDGEVDAPPLAWTLMWDGTYSNLYGHYISDGMRRWGYVFWDAATMESKGADELLRRQWHDEWEIDPRDSL
ncbi:hypothetical protein LTR37_007093 [Vermiconidia calcicola]|uniref:Uncharacterized protein n=1 Tax=Vermiconidia calcicola TaxID=1690605 RepID=A0ACC3NG16_9PEZI|nr:hypothetical protein LTR37_007093 [Vermiconidia calcicola]